MPCALSMGLPDRLPGRDSVFADVAAQCLWMDDFVWLFQEYERRVCDILARTAVALAAGSAATATMDAAASAAPPSGDGGSAGSGAAADSAAAPPPTTMTMASPVSGTETQIPGLPVETVVLAIHVLVNALTAEQRMQ